MNNKKTKQKDYKEEIISDNNKKEDEMGLLGQGRGYFGIPKRANYWLRLIVILVFFVGMGIFLISINQFWAGLISFAVGLMFILFNNLVRD